MKLYLDPGHGGSDPGASGNGLLEKNINLDIALRIRSLLQNYENVDIRMSRTNDTTKSLQQRTNEANSWGADYFLSIHCNAFNGSAQGYEDYIHSALSDSSQTARYRNYLHEEVTKVNQLRNRGKKKANFHVLRESNMPAFLSENGFIDHAGDAALQNSASWRQRVAQGHVNGLVRAFNLKKKDNGGGDTGALFRIIAGSFKSKQNADNRVALLARNNINAFVARVTINGQTWYRVQAGAYSSKANADRQLNRVRSAGVTDAYIIRE